MCTDCPGKKKSSGIHSVQLILNEQFKNLGDIYTERVQCWVCILRWCIFHSGTMIALLLPATVSKRHLQIYHQLCDAKKK